MVIKKQYSALKIAEKIKKAIFNGFLPKENDFVIVANPDPECFGLLLQYYKVTPPNFEVRKIIFDSYYIDLSKINGESSLGFIIDTLNLKDIELTASLQYVFD